MGLFVQTTLYGMRDLKKIIRSRRIGEDGSAKGSQVPRFADVPMSFSSYICGGYEDTYGSRGGIAFEPTQEVVYASPTDSWDLMRSGRFLPGYERFVFNTLKEMLERYPSSAAFASDFRKYFESLTPAQVYPDQDEQFARRLYALDYCLARDWNPGCNEITFSKPMKIDRACIFENREELDKIRDMDVLPELKPRFWFF